MMSKQVSPSSSSEQPKKERLKITVRPTDGELKLLHARAASFGYKSLSKYLVERGLRDGQMIQSIERERIERLLFETRKIGTNLNQIARNMNEGYQGYSQAYLDQALKAVANIAVEIRQEVQR